MKAQTEDEEFDEILKAINRRHYDRISHEKDPENASDIEREVLRQGQKIHEISEQIKALQKSVDRMTGRR